MKGSMMKDSQMITGDINQGIFDKEEMDLKLEIRGFRKDIIRDIMKDGVPKDKRDIRLVNEIMTSVDNEVTETAKLRSANKAQKGDEALKLAILERLTADPVDKAPVINNPHDLIEVEVLKTSLKEGEELDIDDFIAKD